MKSNESLPFTKRQIEIISLWAELGSAIAVSKKLNISQYTVETHLRRARKQANVKRTWELYRLIENKK